MNVSMSNEVKVGLEKLTEENKAYFWHIRYTALFIIYYYIWNTIVVFKKETGSPLRQMWVIPRMLKRSCFPRIL